MSPGGSVGPSFDLRPRTVRIALWPLITRASWDLRKDGASHDRELAIIGAILILAFAIRLPAMLFDGLWRDEANVYVQLAAPNFEEFLRRVMSTEWHPPLFFLIMYCWAKAAGTSEIALKVVPFFFSVATVAVVYRLGRTSGTIATAAIAATLYAVSPLPVAYSSEYLYPLMGFLSTLLALLVARARNHPLTPARVAALACVTLLVVYTHYIGLIYVSLLVLWVLSYGGGLRRQGVAAAALIAGALPFIVWLPVFIHQRQIGIPYASAATGAQKVVFFVRTLAELLPVRPLLLGSIFAAFIIVALVALVLTRRLNGQAAALALIFLTLLGFIAVQNLMASRYVLPYYGLACVFLGTVITGFGSLAAATDAPAWRRWGLRTAAFLAVVVVAADVKTALAAAGTPKSGIRSIVHTPSMNAVTLYVLAPDYLASTFAFYARDTHSTFAGFVRWNEPEVFRLANYAADWNRADAVDRTLRAIAGYRGIDTFLDVVVDDSARDEGHVPYGKVKQLLRDLDGRYRPLGRVRHPGHYEPVTEYRYLLSDRNIRIKR